MADDTNTAQDNTENAATGEDQAGSNSLLTGEGQDGENKEQAATGEQDGSGDEGGDKQADEDAKPQGAPEKYEFKAPDGAELDVEAVAAFEPIAKELNLSNEQAQKLVDLYGTRMMQTAEAQQAAWQKQLDTWVADVKADKEIGGKALDTNVNHAKAAIAKFGTDELKKALDSTGLGNHPELVRVFARIGKAMAEDTFVQTNAASGKRSIEDIFYG